MAIDPNDILSKVKLYTKGLDNNLDDSDMLEIIDDVIDTVGNDDEYFEEVLCKSLMIIADINSATTTKAAQLKSRKIEDVLEESYQNSDENPWERYSQKLPTLCASFGYEDEVSSVVGIIIPEAESIVVESDEMREEIQENYNCPTSFEDDTDFYNLEE